MVTAAQAYWLNRKRRRARNEGVGVSLADELLGSTSNALAVDLRDNSYAMRTVGSPTRGVATNLLTFSRSGIKTRFNSAGLMVDVADGAIALDCDPSAQDVDEPTLKKRLGVSVEGAATEHLTYTEDFTNAAWTKQGVTVTGNAVAAPDGSSTMDLITEDSSTGEHRVYHYYAQTNGEEAAFPFYAMEAGRTQVESHMLGGQGIARFNLSTGAVTNLAGTNHSMQNCGVHPGTGKTIWRCCSIATAISGTASNQQIRLYNGGTSYAGDGASGIHLWGANLAVGRNATSYIKRVSAAASRSADSLTLPVSSITPWSTTGGAVEVSARAPRGNGLAVLWQTDDGTENNRLRIVRDTSGNLRCIVTAGGVEQANLDLGVVAVGVDFSVAFAWAASDFAASLDGGAAVTDTGGSVPAGLTTMRFGHSFTGEHWSSTITSVLYEVP